MNTVINFIIAAIVVCMLIVALETLGGKSACGDQGEVLKFSHYLTFYSGQTMMLMPQYKCEMP